MENEKITTASVKVLDWASARFWAECFIVLGDSSFEVVVAYDEHEGFDLTVTDWFGDEVDGDKFAAMLGYRDADNLCVDLTDGMFSVPDTQFDFQVAKMEVAQ